MPHVAFIGLGSNLEDPHSQLQRAFVDLEGLPGTRLVARSSLYRSAPVGCPDHSDMSSQHDLSSQPDFVNAVAKIATSLSPQALLQALLHIEHQHGRERSFRNAPRTLDMDVLLYDDMQLHEQGLTIPASSDAPACVRVAALAGDRAGCQHTRSGAGATVIAVLP